MDLLAMPKAFIDHHSWYLATLSSQLGDSKLSLLYTNTHAINGFSANLLPEELEALKASPGYISSFKDLPITAATTHSTQFLGLNSNSGAWPVSNYGEDVIIGLVDSGIWPESESFRDDGMSEIPSRWKGECENGTQFNSSLCNKKLIGARFFNEVQRKLITKMIMAPGSLVLASTSNYRPVTWLKNQVLFSNFDIRSGTSYACPHVAGVAALLKSAHPDWSPAAITITTSDALDNTLNPTKDVGYGERDQDQQLASTPLAMGAGHINPNKAMNPGLVYDAGREDYVNLLSALNYSHERIKLIIRSYSFNCSGPSLDLNYPSFIAFFNAYDLNQDSRTVQEFRRTVTKVEEGPATYVANVTSMKGFEVKVVPDKLVFKEKNEKLSFKLSIEGPSLMEETTVFGYLIWVDNKTNLEIRSPIVATNLDSQPHA